MTTALDGAGEGSAKACPHPDARKAQWFQSWKLAMSGSPNSVQRERTTVEPSLTFKLLLLLVSRIFHEDLWIWR
jgi:hypothetical protein